jgi:WD40 repeat protein
MKSLPATLAAIAMLFAASVYAQEIQEDVQTAVSDTILSVAFSPDGRWVAGGGFGRMVKLWTSRDWSLQHTLTGNPQSVRVVAFSPDSRSVAAACDDGILRLWSVEDFRLVRAIKTGDRGIAALSYSPDGKWLATSNTDVDRGTIVGGTVQVWEAATGTLVNEHVVKDDYLASVSFSPDSSCLATGGRTVRIWEVSIGKQLHMLSATTGSSLHVVFSPDGGHLIGAGGQRAALGNRIAGQITEWDLEYGKIARTFAFPDVEHSTSLRCLAISRDGTMIATGGSGRVEVIEQGRTKVLRSELRLWDVSTGKLLRTYEGDLGNFSSLSFSPQGNWLVACDSASVQLIDVPTGQLQERLLQYGRVR